MQVHYLGFINGRQQVRAQLDKAQVLTQVERPQDERGLQHSLGLASYYRCFIPHFTTKSAPLIDLLSKGQPKTLWWVPEVLSLPGLGDRAQSAPNPYYRL